MVWGEIIVTKKKKKNPTSEWRIFFDKLVTAVIIKRGGKSTEENFHENQEKWYREIPQQKKEGGKDRWVSFEIKKKKKKGK